MKPHIKSIFALEPFQEQRETLITVYPFFSRSPYFRGFHGCPSVHENNMTTKSWNMLRKMRATITVLTHMKAYNSSDFRMGDMFIGECLTSVCVQYCTGKQKYVQPTNYTIKCLFSQFFFIIPYLDAKYSSQIQS